MLTKSSTVANFFKEAFDIEWINMVINEPIDVSSFNRKIKTYSSINNNSTFSRVLKIIRKNDVNAFLVYNGNDSFECSDDHKIAVKFSLDKDYTFMEVSKLKGKIFYIFDASSGWVRGFVKKLNKMIPILDFEVEDDHTYYSNGILSHNTIFGNPETTSGGRALKFYSSIRLEVRKKEFLVGKDSEVLGMTTRIKAVKNKTASPFRKGEIQINFGYGLQYELECINFAINYGIIDKKGAWYFYGEQKWQGVDALVQAMKDDSSLYMEIRDKVINFRNSIKNRKEVLDKNSEEELKDSIEE